MSEEDDMATHPTAFGTLLRHFRSRSYLTQARLAERAGLSVAAIAKLERGERQAPRGDTVQILVRALQLPAQDQRALEGAARYQASPAPLLTPVPPYIGAVMQSMTELYARQIALIDALVAIDVTSTH